MREAIRARYQELLAKARAEALAQDLDADDQASLFAEAQKEARKKEGRKRRLSKLFAPRDFRRCYCRDDLSPAFVITYDDWGRGPQCVMCGELKIDR